MLHNGSGGRIQRTLWHGMALIDNGTVAVGSSVCKFNITVVFVMFGDGAHKIGLPSYTFKRSVRFGEGPVV